MQIRFVMNITLLRNMLKNENYKRHIQNCFIRDGKLAGTLKFEKLEIRKENVIFDFDPVKVGGILNIEWSDVHDYVVKYFGTHAPGKDYFNLVEALKKLKVVKFEANASNHTICWENDTDCLYTINVTTKEILGCKWFTKSSIEKLMYELSDKNITKEQFLIAYNEVFGGLQ